MDMTLLADDNKNCIKTREIKLGFSLTDINKQLRLCQRLLFAFSDANQVTSFSP